ncbi:hypothetical protein BASA81_016782 [Batrachochytrium salamandrivorans]|nr:hypothetical protein BASA81_016782 [Batrachochytrium salamandrivorans]
MVAVPGNVHQMKLLVLLLVLLCGVGVGVLVQAVSLIALTTTLQSGFLVANVFHFRCLRSWIERQQACPTRRRSVMDIPGYLDQFQHLGTPPVQMEFPGVHGMAQAPIYLTPLGPAPSSMLMPQNFSLMQNSVQWRAICVMRLSQRLEAIGRIQTQLAGITAQFNQMLHMLPTETPVDESQKHK